MCGRKTGPLSQKNLALVLTTNHHLRYRLNELFTKMKMKLPTTGFTVGWGLNEIIYGI